MRRDGLAGGRGLAIEGQLGPAAHRLREPLEVTVAAAVALDDRVELFDVVLPDPVDGPAVFVDDRLTVAIDPYGCVAALVVEQREPLRVGDRRVLPEITAENDDEVERGELAIEVRGLLALAEGDA